MKLFKSIITFVLLLSTIFSVSSCSLFYSPEGGGGMFNKNEDVELVLHNGTETKTCTVQTGKIVSVDLFHNPGYLFKGYFSAETGGEQYFDSKGASLVAWKSSFPTALYAQWENIYDMSYESQEYFVTKALAGEGATGRTFELPSEFVAAISDNPSAKMKMTIDFKAKYVSDWSKYPLTLTVQDKAGAEGEKIGKASKNLSSDYQSYSFEFEFDARLLRNGEFYWWMNNNSSGYFVTFYIKDFSYTLSFVE